MTGRQMSRVLVVFLIAALVLEIDRSKRRWRASRVLATVKAVTVQAELRGLLSTPLVESNIKLLRDARRLSPAEVALPIALGGQYLMLERPRAAIRVFEEALRLEPRGEVYAQIGRAELQSGHRDEADQAFRMAILLDHTQRKRLRSYLKRREPRPPEGTKSTSPEEVFSSSPDSGETLDSRPETSRP